MIAKGGVLELETNKMSAKSVGLFKLIASASVGEKLAQNIITAECTVKRINLKEIFSF